jgi:hypothetical protein
VQRAHEYHPVETAQPAINLVLVFRDKLLHGVLLDERVLAVRTRVLGEEHQSTLTSMNNLASTLGLQGDHTGARRLHERVLGISARVLGEEHPDTLTSTSNLSATLEAQGDHDGAIRLLRQCLAGRRKVLGVDHPATVTTAKALVRLEAQPPTIPPSS